MKQQVPLIRGGWKAVERVLDNVCINPIFPKFASWCRKNGVSLKVVSDGIDKVIHHILKREKIHVDNVWANHLFEMLTVSSNLASHMHRRLLVAVPDSANAKFFPPVPAVM